MYAAFVDASNAVLACLRDLKIEGMRDPLSKRPCMFFQRNDPTVLSHSHAEKLLRRTPDVVILPNDHRSDYRDGNAQNNAGEAPMSNLWKDVLSVIEFSRSGMVAPPPEIYGVTEYKATEPEYFAIGPDGADANIVVDPSTTSQDVPPSGQAKSEQDPGR